MPPTMQIFTFLFLMLGPFKIIGPFVKLTRTAEPALARKIALYATFYAGIGLFLAGFLGENMLGNFGIPVPILAISGGLILFLVALLNIISQFTPTEPAEKTEVLPTLNMALNPLAFPTIVTPYGIAAVIVLISLSPDTHAKLIIGAIVAGIMVINLIIMLVSRYIFRALSVFLSIMGTILSVVQVALGLMIIYNQAKVLFACAP